MRVSSAVISFISVSSVWPKWWERRSNTIHTRQKYTKIVKAHWEHFQECPLSAAFHMSWDVDIGGFYTKQEQVTNAHVIAQVCKKLVSFTMKLHVLHVSPKFCSFLPWSCMFRMYRHNFLIFTLNNELYLKPTAKSTVKTLQKAPTNTWQSSIWKGSWEGH